MSTATATSGTHLPEPHTGLIDARLIQTEDAARGTTLYTIAAREGV